MTASLRTSTTPTPAPHNAVQAGEPPAAPNPPRSPAGARLTLSGATLGRPGSPVLHDVDLDVPPGQILTVVGASGCGKSTLLRTLAGLLAPLAGTAGQDGEPFTAPAADRALVFQEDALLPWRTLQSNVELPLAVRGLARRERREQAAHWLRRVELADRARHLPHRVSGGQRQRVQLARALAGSPRAVLMDEPFGALDVQTGPECRSCSSTCSAGPARPWSS